MRPLVQVRTLNALMARKRQIERRTNGENFVRVALLVVLFFVLLRLVSGSR